MTRVVLFALSAVSWILLTSCVFVLTRLASWVVPNDHVWIQMNTDGLRAEHTFLETLHVLNALPLTFLTAITGIVFLALLYRFFFAGSEPGAPLRAQG